MAYLPAPDLSGAMGVDNAAVLVAVSLLDRQPDSLDFGVLVSPTADMLGDLDQAGIQAVPIVG